MFAFAQFGNVPRAGQVKARIATGLLIAQHGPQVARRIKPGDQFGPGHATQVPAIAIRLVERLLEIGADRFPFKHVPANSRQASRSGKAPVYRALAPALCPAALLRVRGAPS